MTRRDTSPPIDSPDSSDDWSGKDVFTTGEAARVCNVSQQTIIRCFDNGRLQGFRVPGSKFRRIPRAELVRFMMDNGIPTDRLETGRKRVLVVDDDAQIVSMLTDILGREGRYDVRAAGNAYDAGIQTVVFKPHLVVLDFMLPDLRGDVVLQRLHERPETMETRIICVSGVAQQDQVSRLINAGADAFFRKPFNIESLVAKIDELLASERPARSKGA